MTSSGYPRQVKLWKRGTLLKDAELIFEGQESDVSVGGYVMRDGSKSYTRIIKYPTTFKGTSYVWVDNKPVLLDLPEDVQIEGIHANQLILNLKSDWSVNGRTYTQGSLVSLNFTDLIAGKKEAAARPNAKATTAATKPGGLIPK